MDKKGKSKFRVSREQDGIRDSLLPLEVFAKSSWKLQENDSEKLPSFDSRRHKII